MVHDNLIHDLLQLRARIGIAHHVHVRSPPRPYVPYSVHFHVGPLYRGSEPSLDAMPLAVPTAATHAPPPHKAAPTRLDPVRVVHRDQGRAACWEGGMQSR